MGVTVAKKKKMEKITDYIRWFEIPAINFQQSVDFYNKIFGINMETNIDDNYAMAFFPAKDGVGGAIVAGPGSIPGIIGPLLYLNAGKDLNIVLKRVESAGGRIVMTKTFINEDSGYFAIFIDSEGNKLALHSKK